MEEQRQEGTLCVGEANDIPATGGLQSVKAPSWGPGDKEWIDQEVDWSRSTWQPVDQVVLYILRKRESTEGFEQWNLRKITVVAAMLKNYD